MFETKPLQENFMHMWDRGYAGGGLFFITKQYWQYDSEIPVYPLPRPNVPPIKKKTGAALLA